MIIKYKFMSFTSSLAHENYIQVNESVGIVPEDLLRCTLPKTLICRKQKWKPNYCKNSLFYIILIIIIPSTLMISNSKNLLEQQTLSLVHCRVLTNEMPSFNALIIANRAFHLYHILSELAPNSPDGHN